MRLFIVAITLVIIEIDLFNGCPTILNENING